MEGILAIQTNDKNGVRDLSKALVAAGFILGKPLPMQPSE
jgi:hypothetical protein